MKPRKQSTPKVIAAIGVLQLFADILIAQVVNTFLQHPGGFVCLIQDADGSIERTEADSDVQRVHTLFSLLYRFVTDICPGFQIIVTEHATLRDDWFQQALVEKPWTKPPALIPEDWPTSL